MGSAVLGRGAGRPVPGAAPPRERAGGGLLSSTERPASEWTLPAPPNFRLAPTVCSHGAFQCPPFHWDADQEVLTRVLRVPGDGPRVVRIDERETERVELRDDPAEGLRPEEVRAIEVGIHTPGWAPSEDAGVEIEERVVFMLGLDRSLHGFHELCREHPSLSRIPGIGAGRLLRCPTLWEELVKAICGTNVRWNQAVRMIERIAELGEPVDGLNAWPVPARVLDAGRSYLEDTARVGYRAPYVLELARSIEDGTLDPAPVEAGLLGEDELRRLFLDVDGIGPVTAEHLLTLYGHTDRLSIDSAVVAFVRDRHFGGRTPSEDEIRELYEEYGEWKALAYWFEFVQEVWWPAIGVEF